MDKRAVCFILYKRFRERLINMIYKKDIVAANKEVEAAVRNSMLTNPRIQDVFVLELQKKADRLQEAYDGQQKAKTISGMKQRLYPVYFVLASVHGSSTWVAVIPDLQVVGIYAGKIITTNDNILRVENEAVKKQVNDIAYTWACKNGHYVPLTAEVWKEMS